jgi:hypothetical protein
LKANTFLEISALAARTSDECNATDNEVAKDQSCDPDFTLSNSNSTTPQSEVLNTMTSLAATEGSTEEPIKKEKLNLEEEIESTRPYFAEFGGAVRNIIVMPSAMEHGLDTLQKLTFDEKKVTMLLSDKIETSSILCLSERIVLSELMDRVWMPSQDIWNLANRIMARVDVDWLPVSGIKVG